MLTSDHKSPVDRCLLCDQEGRPFKDGVYLECLECGGIFRPQRDHPSVQEEKTRYEEHQNDVDDAGYQRFVSPITAQVQTDFASDSRGLDFGSGTGPVISKLLVDAGYDIKQYDPIFSNHPDLLESRYDYIVCCEVIEHFHDPAREFNLLKSLLKPGGKLYCMTLLYHEGIDFANWHYRRDPTHVFIFQKRTLEWVREHTPFSGLAIEDRLIVFDA